LTEYFPATANAIGGTVVGIAQAMPDAANEASQGDLQSGLNTLFGTNLQPTSTGDYHCAAPMSYYASVIVGGSGSVGDC
jgi:hypothetical protein